MLARELIAKLELLHPETEVVVYTGEFRDRYEQTTGLTELTLVADKKDKSYRLAYKNDRYKVPGVEIR